MIYIIGGIGVVVMIVGAVPGNGALVLLGVALITGTVVARMVNDTAPPLPTELTTPTVTAAARQCDEREGQLHQRLLVMAHGDRALAERLIGYEARRTPSCERAELIDAAVERWVRDLNG